MNSAPQCTLSGAPNFQDELRLLGGWSNTRMPEWEQMSRSRWFRGYGTGSSDPSQGSAFGNLFWQSVHVENRGKANTRLA
jgi:hypothetical protein